MTNDEGNMMKISSYTHIQQSLATSMRGNVATERGIRKIENLEISKFVGGV